MLCEMCEENEAETNKYCKDCNSKHLIRCDECGRDLFECNCGDVTKHDRVRLCSTQCAKAFYSGDK